jgi:hypothetical protein
MSNVGSSSGTSGSVAGQHEAGRGLEKVKEGAKEVWEGTKKDVNERYETAKEGAKERYEETKKAADEYPGTYQTREGLSETGTGLKKAFEGAKETTSTAATVRARGEEGGG